MILLMCNFSACSTGLHYFLNNAQYNNPLNNLESENKTVLDFALVMKMTNEVIENKYL